MNVTALLSKVEKAISDVKNGMDTMVRAKSNTENATRIAENVLALSIPVEQTTIHDLSMEILKIPINESLVNATLENATAGLKTAEEAQMLSEKAM